MMNNRFTSRLLQKWQGYILCVIFAYFVLPISITAQTMSENGVISNACSTPPNQQCCLGFVFDNTSAANPCTSIDITLNPGSGTPADCWNWGCMQARVVSTTGNGFTPIINTNSTTHHATITFSHIVGGIPVPGNIPVNTIVDIILCPSTNPACIDIFPTYSWQSTDDQGNTTSGTGVNLDSCIVNDGLYSCSDCDSTQITNNGQCSVTICYYIGGGNQDKDIVFNFSSALTHDNIFGPSSPSDPCFGTHLVLPSGWTIPFGGGGAPGDTYMTLHCGTPLSACHWLCFTMPKTSSGGAPQTVTGHGLHYVGTPCAPQTVTFKKGFGNSNENQNGIQNFPNPVTRNNNFKTVIPFELTHEGDVILTVSNSSGVTVYTETSSFVDGGKHFFYITAKDLPTGTYYYTIESPKGMVIVKQHLIVVK